VRVCARVCVCIHACLNALVVVSDYLSQNPNYLVSSLDCKIKHYLHQLVTSHLLFPQMKRMDHLWLKRVHIEVISANY